GSRRWQRLRRHTLDLAPAIGPHDLPNESHLHANAAVGISVGGELCRENFCQKPRVCAGVFNSQPGEVASQSSLASSILTSCEDSLTKGDCDFVWGALRLAGRIA